MIGSLADKGNLRALYHCTTEELSVSQHSANHRVPVFKLKVCELQSWQLRFFLSFFPPVHVLRISINYKVCINYRGDEFLNCYSVFKLSVRKILRSLQTCCRKSQTHF